MQANDSITRGYFYIRFIDFMFKSKNVTDFINLCFPYDFKKNYKVILK